MNELSWDCAGAPLSDPKMEDACCSKELTALEREPATSVTVAAPVTDCTSD